MKYLSLNFMVLHMKKGIYTMKEIFTVNTNLTKEIFVSIIGCGLRVNLVDTRESYSNANNHNDEMLLHFDVCKLQSDGSWKQLNDGSSCTQLSKNDSIDILIQAAIFIWTSFYAVLNYAPANNDNTKHICERCSFLSAVDFPKNV